MNCRSHTQTKELLFATDGAHYRKTLQVTLQYLAPTGTSTTELLHVKLRRPPRREGSLKNPRKNIRDSREQDGSHQVLRNLASKVESSLLKVQRYTRVGVESEVTNNYQRLAAPQEA